LSIRDYIFFPATGCSVAPARRLSPELLITEAMLNVRVIAETVTEPF